MSASSFAASSFAASSFAASSFAATTIAAVAATTSAAAGHLFDERVDLVIRSRAVLYHLAREVQLLSCERVVSVYRYAVSLHFSYAGREMIFLGIGQCDEGSREYILGIKLPVHHEDVTRQLVNTLGIVFAKGLGRCEGKVKLRTLFQGQYVFLQSFE